MPETHQICADVPTATFELSVFMLPVVSTVCIHDVFYYNPSLYPLDFVTSMTALVHVFSFFAFFL